MKAVTYHYVRPNTNAPPYSYYHLNLDDFRQQLNYLAEHYRLISQKKFLGCVTGECRPPDDAVILTFDDGLLDHYKHVLPELRDRNLWGLFFVPGPVGDTPLAVHRVHTLLGTTPAERVAAELNSLVGDDDLRHNRSEEFDRTYSESSASEAMTMVKRTLNYFLSYDRIPAVLNALERQFPAARIDPEQLYMSPDQIGSLVDAGMLIGGHTVSHKVLSRLGTSEQRSELERSLAYVSDTAGNQPIQSFAYPYGATETFDSDTLAILRDADCNVSFTTERGNITENMITENPLTLPRHDCTEFPYGESSIE